MLGEMKFEESSLTGYLVKHLEPLTEANPAILAEYVVALLKKDKPAKELQKLCTDNLVEFLGHSAKSFVAKLFQDLEGGLISRSGEDLEVTKKIEPSESPHTLEAVQPKNVPAREENNSTSSESRSDHEEKDASEDDDDDRNHKHRRREAQPNSFDKGGQEQATRRPNRKRNKPYENGQLYSETDPQSSDFQKEYTPSEKENPSKFEKRRSGLMQQSRAPLDLGPRTRVSQGFRSDPGSRFDLSTSVGRSSGGRGRGRSTIWGQHDSRFNPLETLDFPSQMASQGPPLPSLFMGTGLPGAASTQTASWGSFGFIPGMSNNILDPLHPLSLPGPLGPTIAPPLNLGMPRQRCRDFEERGFCLRGDMCPMEHGVNRIVVEDVQSLSQFNLPVSIPSSRAPGVQTSVAAPSSQNNKVVHGKNNKSGVTDDALELNGVLSSGGGEADVYDPDQPLWNNDRPESSNALFRLASPNIHDEPSWDADSSGCQTFRLSDGAGSERPTGNLAGNVGSQTTTSSVWGRIRSKAKTETPSKDDHHVSCTGYLETEIKEDREEQIIDAHTSSHAEDACTQEMGPKSTGLHPGQRPRTHLGHNGGKPFQKASRTLYVNGIPRKNNRREALLSHFQKFGEVIDIYIPLNSEKAFVQFSKREEAEAALKAPDAVMGNRFIKLWWANRDRIPDDGHRNLHAKTLPSNGLPMGSVPSHSSVADRGKENLPSGDRKGSSVHAAEASLPMPSPSKNLKENGSKTAHPVQKKGEALESLKDEIRKKQEILAQKRDEFRRQLDKLAKQAISVKKGEVVPEQPVKRPKVDKGNEAAKDASLSPQNPSTTGVCQETEKTQETIMGEMLVSPTSKANSTVQHQSPKDIRQTSRLPVPLLGRFKLDNRPTSFRVLPPLPVDLTNETALKEHFSSFGELSSVVLEDPEVFAENPGLQLSQACSACIKFTTRHSAEKAFLGGKYWKGHSLKFVWLTVSPKSNNECATQEVSPTLKRVLDSGIQAELVTSGSSSSVECRPTSNAISRPAGTWNHESSNDVKSTNAAPLCVPKALAHVSQSNSSMSSIEKQPPYSDDSTKDSASFPSTQLGSKSGGH